MSIYIFLLSLIIIVFQSYSLASEKSIGFLTNLKNCRVSILASYFDVKKIVKQYVEPQKNSWSCGPNTGTRYLKYYNYDVSYEELMTKQSNQTLIVYTGTTPIELKALLKPYKSDVQYKSQASFSDIKEQLCHQKPVIVLVKSRRKRLHWVMLVGFIENEQGHIDVMYVDTFGYIHSKKYADFMNSWNWTIEGLILPAALKLQGILPKTMIF